MLLLFCIFASCIFLINRVCKSAWSLGRRICKLAKLQKLGQCQYKTNKQPIKSLQYYHMPSFLSKSQPFVFDKHSIILNHRKELAPICILCIMLAKPDRLCQIEIGPSMVMQPVRNVETNVIIHWSLKGQWRWWLLKQYNTRKSTAIGILTLK